MRVSYYSYLSALAVICLFAHGDSFAVEGVEMLKSDQAKQDASGHKGLLGFLFYDKFSNRKDGGKVGHVIVDEDSRYEW
uniref:RxLR effector candidate protein n=1 Tax=Hyaloperonospora arabidopsidis (strain Emoy2) TaxID=559515 RepID=M4C331_HYAAE